METECAWYAVTPTNLIRREHLEVRVFSEWATEKGERTYSEGLVRLSVNLYPFNVIIALTPQEAHDLGNALADVAHKAVQGAAKKDAP